MMRPNPGNTSTRPAAVAGSFYPEDPGELRTVIAQYLYAATAIAGSNAAPPKALIVPHAGYRYSAPVAAVAYSLLQPLRGQVRRVVLIGPAHRVYLRGVAVPQADAFATPLGAIPVDRDAKAALLADAAAIESDAAHELEHSIEVQLPFLQYLLGDFTLLPLVAGAAVPQVVADVLARVWGGPETLIVVSSDLSHYHPYAQARHIDAATAAAILDARSDLQGEQACGAVAINGLMVLARQRGFAVEELARLNSGDTAGDRAQVVGYGAFALRENPAGRAH